MRPSAAGGRRSIKLGTRGSKLALIQAGMVVEALEGRAEPVVIRTSGDRGNRDVQGAFVHEIQQAVFDGTVDFAVHCLKDLPTRPVPGLVFAAYLEREDPRDAILCREGWWKDLPDGARVGTGSLRRTSQLRSLAPRLDYRPMVGNVDSRLQKMRDGQYDAIVLAVAGLRRLGLEVSYEIVDILPAPGQGVLVLECREDDVETQATLARLNHPATERAAKAERSFLAAFGGGCSLPVGALATVSDGLTLEGLMASPDGSVVLRDVLAGSEPEGVGKELADRLIARGARELIPK